MRWHQGSIVEAVTVSKENRSIFVVFIHDDKDISKQMEECFNEESVSRTLENKCVSLKLESNSDGAKQFSQIYPVVIVPSIFFIGLNGIPLEVIGGQVDPQQLMQKINKIYDLHDQQKDNSASGGVASSNSATTGEASSSAQLTDASVNKTSAENSPPESASLIENEILQVNSSNESPIELNERIERAKILIAKKQEEKAKEEAEKEKQKEIERRQLGKNLQDFKQRQKDMELQKLADEIARERAEEKRARENIREQIARDRAERADKYKAEKDAEEVQKQEAAQLKRDQANAETTKRSNYARLQLKLPDGTPVVQQFDADTQLQEVYNFVKETVKPPFASFRLCLIFPRRDFEKGDYSQTLRDLDLVPNASILIIPESSKSIVSPSPKLTNIIWTVLSPLLAMWRFVYNFVFGAPAVRPEQQIRNTSGTNPRNFRSDSGRPELKRPRLSNQETNRNFARRDGNIHRISDGKDDEDENNTWNGNSTQQM